MTDNYVNMPLLLAHIDPDNPPDPSTIYQWIKKRGFPASRRLPPTTVARRQNRAWWDLDAVDAWLAEQGD